jgi:small subunit ribosomal protein S1
VGDKVEAKIINVDRKNRVIGLSIKAKDVQEEKEAMRALKDQESENAPTTIGDLIKAQMESGRNRAE